MVSCFSDDDLVDDFEVITDAYVIKKKSGEEPVYAVSFYAFANQFMRSVTATEMGGSGEKINLAQDPTSILVMSKKPQESDFRSYAPATSDYLFQVVAESGISVDSYDFLSYDDIDIPEIVKTEFNESNKLLEIDWNEAEGADGYLVKILNSEGTEISVSQGFENDVTDYTINVVLESWVVVPEPGETYTIQVHAFAYEPEFDEGYEVYNVQEVSIAEESIVWP
ncbi:MAG: hypothetical protein ABFS16_11855 [Bacteroidota bacterium]